MKTRIIRVDCPWEEIKNDCRTSVGKDDIEGTPSHKFKLNLLIAEHSPITQLRIKFAWDNIKSWISVHFTRHWLGWFKIVQSQRDDRTPGETNRDKAPQDTPVNMKVEANAQSLINVANLRLCGQASNETREYMEDLKVTVNGPEPEISYCMVPSCVYRCGCPEMGCCGLWPSFMKWAVSNGYLIENFVNIKQRYKLFNEYFYSDEYFFKNK